MYAVAYFPFKFQYYFLNETRIKNFFSEKMQMQLFFASRKVAPVNCFFLTNSKNGSLKDTF
ncbi:hypothetical protein AHMF7605_19280 [Adhaeribacter arboris]|uniref:Uncharacterized protein n=1 Tax=Adhaeribacter arboris TaxID=2072846 RepID=A0A2T2YJ12_9BACT|nr:hypothetical protein AHMF7605_19280 [Adhaeribacter arboris]